MKVATPGPAAEIRAAWEEHSGPLSRFIARRVGDPHDADDVLQEVFLKAHAALVRDKGPERLKPWLYRIAENAVADHHRAHARERALGVRTAPVAEERDEPAEEAAAPPPNANAEVARCLTPMIGELPEGYRRALVLADLEGKGGRAVAEELGLSVAGAKSRVRRARQKLRAVLRACCRLELDRAGNVLGCERKEFARRYRC